jgi:hypothetical protein
VPRLGIAVHTDLGIAIEDPRVSPMIGSGFFVRAGKLNWSVDNHDLSLLLVGTESTIHKPYDNVKSFREGS